jgi:serine/threonine-protein phosphatase 2B regulatory subunit
MSHPVEEITNYFNRTDLDHNGFIDTKEFNIMLRRMGILLPPDDEARLFKAMDGSGSGSISLQDFIKNYPTIMALERKAEEKQIRHMLEKTTFTEQEVKRMLYNFKKVSTSVVDDGVIDKKEFRAMMTDGAPSTESPNSVFFDALFRMFDRDSSGEIDFQEFVSSLALYFGKVKDPQHTKDRAHFFFNIFDVDRDGIIGEKDLRLMLTDCLVSNNVPISQADLEKLVQSTLAPYGKGLDLRSYTELSAGKSSQCFLEEDVAA